MNTVRTCFTVLSCALLLACSEPVTLHSSYAAAAFHPSSASHRDPFLIEPGRHRPADYSIGPAFGVTPQSQWWVSPVVNPQQRDQHGLPRMMAAVHLPHGARVSELKAVFFDTSSSTEVEVRLVRSRIEGAETDTHVTTQMAAVSSGVAHDDGHVVRSIQTIDTSVIDNAVFAYFLEAERSDAIPKGEGTHMLGPVRLAYVLGETRAELAPYR